MNDDSPELPRTERALLSRAVALAVVAVLATLGALML
jgi:hypothetical protein